MRLQTKRVASGLTSILILTAIAWANGVFNGPTDVYNIILTTLTETDGESTYNILIDGKKIGEFTNPEIID